MIARWFARVLREAFSGQMDRARAEGYRDGHKAGMAEGLERGFDKWVAQAVHGDQSVEIGAAALFRERMREPV